jgi:hypothetical protein
MKAVYRAAALGERDRRWGYNPATPNSAMIAYEQGNVLFKQFAEELRQLQEAEPRITGACFLRW